MQIPFPHPQSALLARIKKIRAFLSSDQAILISLPTDVVYFSGFQMLVPEEREGFYVVTPSNSYLIKASFSPSPADVVGNVLENCRPSALAHHLKMIMEKEKLKVLFYDETNLFVEELRMIGEHLPNGAVTKPFLRDWIFSLRNYKDEFEVAALAAAGKIIAQVLEEIPRFFAEGTTELELSQIVVERIRALGAESVAFPTIVAFGSNGTSPHYQPADVPLKANTSILIDAGAMVHGYRSDMTRTWWFGSQPDPLFLEIEHLVKTAHDKTLKLLSGAKELQAKDLDTMARSYIDTAGFGKYFIHTTGHGIGLDIHEQPSLSWSNQHLIEPGMVITIEPGIYLPEKFGYRYENTILVTENGYTLLTQFS